MALLDEPQNTSTTPPPAAWLNWLVEHLSARVWLRAAGREVGSETIAGNR